MHPSINIFRCTKVEQELQEKESLVSRLQENIRQLQEEQTRLLTQTEEKTKLVEKRWSTIWRPVKCAQNKNKWMPSKREMRKTSERKTLIENEINQLKYCS